MSLALWEAYWESHPRLVLWHALTWQRRESVALPAKRPTHPIRSNRLVITASSDPQTAPIYGLLRVAMAHATVYSMSYSTASGKCALQYLDAETASGVERQLPGVQASREDSLPLHPATLLLRSPTIVALLEDDDGVRGMTYTGETTMMLNDGGGGDDENEQDNSGDGSVVGQPSLYRRRMHQADERVGASSSAGLSPSEPPGRVKLLTATRRRSPISIFSMFHRLFDIFGECRIDLATTTETQHSATVAPPPSLAPTSSSPATITGLRVTYTHPLLAAEDAVTALSELQGYFIHDWDVVLTLEPIGTSPPPRSPE